MEHKSDCLNVKKMDRNCKNYLQKKNEQMVSTAF